MSPTVFAAGSTALISGGASGVGLAIAKICKSKDMNIFLVDRNTETLEAAKKELSGSTSKVEVAVADVSKPEDWEKVKTAVAGTFGSVEFLVLNAGLGMKGGWGDNDYFKTTLETNLFGVIYGLNAFLPLVKESAKTKQTAVVFTGSKQGITNPPGNPAYNASKAAVKVLAEQLSYDLKGTKTNVHLLVPGWTYTPLTGAAAGKTKPDGAWTPEQVADYMYEKMGENQFWILCPDNDVTTDTDKRRMMWSVGDAVNGRPPLSRWREEFKEEATETMKKFQI